MGKVSIELGHQRINVISPSYLWPLVTMKKRSASILASCRAIKQLSPIVLINSLHNVINSLAFLHIF